MIYVLWPTVRPLTCKQTLKCWRENSSLYMFPHIEKETIQYRFAVDTYSLAVDMEDLDYVKIVEPTKLGVCEPLYALTSELEPNDDDFIIVSSDDFFPPKNWDKLLLNVLIEHGHGVYIFHDNCSERFRQCITIPIMSGKAFKMLKKNIYPNAYEHLCSDVEFWDNANDLKLIKDFRGKNSPLHDVIFEHRHWSVKKRKFDENDKTVCDVHSNGKQLYSDRKKLSLSQRLETLPDRYSTKLSILIASVAERKHFLNELMMVLKPQLTPEVEVLISYDTGISIGEKRNRLLRSSKGKYCVFIDDDDLVSRWYVGLILSAIKQDPDVVGFKLKILPFKKLSKLEYNVSTEVIHSLRYEKWNNVSVPQERTPNHLNPIKRELLIKNMFNNINFGEDRQFSESIVNLLTNEIFIDKELYFYRYGIVHNSLSFR